MSVIRLLYSNDNPITITLASLADGSTATSNSINNSANEFISADIQITLKTGGSVDTANGSVTVSLIRSADGGATFDDSNTNADVLGVFDANVASQTYVFSIDSSRLGTLPNYWKIAITNNSGGVFDSTAGNFTVVYSGKNFQVS